MNKNTAQQFLALKVPDLGFDEAVAACQWLFPNMPNELIRAMAKATA